MNEIDEDAHLALWLDDVTCEELNYMYACGGIAYPMSGDFIAAGEELNYIYAGGGVAYPVSGDFITTGRLEERWSLTSDD